MLCRSEDGDWAHVESITGKKTCSSCSRSSRHRGGFAAQAPLHTPRDNCLQSKETAGFGLSTYSQDHILSEITTSLSLLTRSPSMPSSICSWNVYCHCAEGTSHTSFPPSSAFPRVNFPKVKSEVSLSLWTATPLLAWAKLVIPVFSSPYQEQPPSISTKASVLTLDGNPPPLTSNGMHRGSSHLREPDNGSSPCPPLGAGSTNLHFKVSDQEFDYTKFPIHTL